jgi:hypothetical protein
MNPLQRLVEAGQSIWLDYLRRSLITGGGLKELMDKDAVGGLTSNPTIFGRAIAASTDYDEGIHKLVAGQRSSPRDVFYELALEDIIMAADVFSTVYERTAGKDGFVSFELEPAVAHDTEASIKAARELVGKIARPNVMIKVPGTPGEGIATCRQGRHRQREGRLQALRGDLFRRALGAPRQLRRKGSAPAVGVYWDQESPLLGRLVRRRTRRTRHGQHDAGGNAGRLS